MFVVLPGEGQHALHSLVIDPDGTIYVGVGSSCNVCSEEDCRRASVLRFAADGSEAVHFASGLRNPSGIALDPTSGAVWVTDAGREGLGQFLPPEELNQLGAGLDFGWPYCFGNRVPDPTVGGGDEICALTEGPRIELIAHSNPSGLAFYSGDSFPEMYDGGVFVALHGSLDEYLPTGVSVVFLPFESGQPTGEVVGFVEGWLMPDTRRWGIPADVAMAPDGTLFISDEGAGRIYRVYYGGSRATATPYP
jgi:glucose/arabinose dehydrogenase